MYCNAFLLLKSVVTDANSIQMPTLQVRIWAENAGVGVSHLAAETMGVWWDKGDLTTQQINDKVRECFWEITQSVTFINKQGPGPEQWDLVINRCITRISDLGTILPLCKWYITAKTDLNGQKLKPALDEFTAVGFCWRKIRLYKTPTGMRNLVQIGMYYIAPMLPWILPMLCRFSRQWGWNLRLQVFTGIDLLQCLNRCPCRTIVALPMPMSIPTLLRKWWVTTMFSYFHGTGLRMMYQYYW